MKSSHASRQKTYKMISKTKVRKAPKEVAVANIWEGREHFRYSRLPMPVENCWKINLTTWSWETRKSTRRKLIRGQWSHHQALLRKVEASLMTIAKSINLGKAKRARQLSLVSIRSRISSRRLVKNSRKRSSIYPKQRNERNLNMTTRSSRSSNLSFLTHKSTHTKPNNLAKLAKRLLARLRPKLPSF